MSPELGTSQNSLGSAYEQFARQNNQQTSINGFVQYAEKLEQNSDGKVDGSIFNQYGKDFLDEIDKLGQGQPVDQKDERELEHYYDIVRSNMQSSTPSAVNTPSQPASTLTQPANTSTQPQNFLQELMKILSLLIPHSSTVRPNFADSTYSPHWQPNSHAVDMNRLKRLAGIPGNTGTPVPNGSSPTGHALKERALQPDACTGGEGQCYHYTKISIKDVLGIELTGGSASEAADQLAQHPDKVTEVNVSRDKLKELPEGAIVVWGPGRNANGHIGITLGDGNEVSDRIRPQETRFAPSYRVFVPNDMVQQSDT